MATSNHQSTCELMPCVFTVAHLVYMLPTVTIVVGSIGAATGERRPGYTVLANPLRPSSLPSPERPLPATSCGLGHLGAFGHANRRPLPRRDLPDIFSS
jgi:hypothetical protein